MEQLNRVELIGYLGTVKIFSVGDTKLARFSLATNAAFSDRQGNLRIETTWHNVSAWQSDRCRDLEQLAKGDRIHVIGRLRNNRYTSADGAERVIQEIVARQIEVLNEQIRLDDETINTLSV